MSNSVDQIIVTKTSDVIGIIEGERYEVCPWGERITFKGDKEFTISRADYRRLKKNGFLKAAVNIPLN